MMENAAPHRDKITGINFNLKTLVKLVVSATLLTAVIFKIPLSSFEASLTEFQWPCLFLSLTMVNLCMLVSALKWQPLLTTLRIQIPFLKLLSFYYVGLFANNFLPSSIGGDALRIIDVARASGKTKEAAASVIMERLLASLALALTAAAALTFGSRLEGNSYVYWLIGGLVVACMAAIGLLFCFPFKENGRIGNLLYRLGEYREQPGTLCKVLLFSFLFQGLLVVANVFAFQSLGADIPLVSHFLYIPVIMAVSMLPLSINGLGIREGMYVVLYKQSGVDPAVAVACSLVFFILVGLSSLAGGVILAVRK